MPSNALSDGIWNYVLSLKWSTKKQKPTTHDYIDSDIGNFPINNSTVSNASG